MNSDFEFQATVGDTENDLRKKIQLPTERGRPKKWKPEKKTQKKKRSNSQ